MDNFSLTGESLPPPLDSFDPNHLESRNLTRPTWVTWIFTDLEDLRVATMEEAANANISFDEELAGDELAGGFWHLVCIVISFVIK